MKKLLILLITCISLAAGCDDVANNSLLSLTQATGLLNLSATTTAALPPSTSWYTMFGDSATQYAYSVQQTKDNGYIVAGYSGSPGISLFQGKAPLNAYTGSGDILVVKLNALGYVSWYTYLGSNAGVEYAYSIQQTADKGFIIAGYADANIATLQGKKPLIPYTGNEDMLVVKLNASGNVAWYTFLGSTADDRARSVQQTKDLGFIIIGDAGGNIASLKGKAPLNGYAGNYDMLVVKLTSLGALSWYTFIGSTGTDYGYSVSQTADKGYIIGGHANAKVTTLDGVGTPSPLNSYNTGYDFLVVKLLPTGHVSWYTFIGGAGTDYCRSVQQTVDGGYIIAGESSDTIATLPTNATGGTTTPNNAQAGAGYYDMLVVKLNTTGYTEWYTFLGLAASNTNEYCKSVQQTADRGYILAGYTSTAITALANATEPLIAYTGNSDGLIVKLDDAGGVSGFTFLGGASSDYAFSIQQTTDGGYIVAGYAGGDIYEMGGMWPVYQNSGGYDFFIVKLNPGGGL
jgi:hypothetical protein